MTREANATIMGYSDTPTTNCYGREVAAAGVVQEIRYDDGLVATWSGNQIVRTSIGTLPPPGTRIEVCPTEGGKQAVWIVEPTSLTDRLRMQS